VLALVFGRFVTRFIAGRFVAGCFVPVPSFLDLRLWAFLKRYLDILFLILVLRSRSWIVVLSVFFFDVLVLEVFVLNVIDIRSLKSFNKSR